MSLKSIIPKTSKLCVIGGIFKSSFGVPTVARYDFTKNLTAGNRTNVAVSLGLAMNPSYLYFFHQINFSMSIDEGTFLQAIETGTVPELSIKDSTSRKNIFNQPVRLFRYFENAAIDSYHLNLNANTELIADFQAVLIQVADLVGVADIFAQVSLSVYEITEEEFIKSYKKEQHK